MGINVAYVWHPQGNVGAILTPKSSWAARAVAHALYRKTMMKSLISCDIICRNTRQKKKTIQPQTGKDMKYTKYEMNILKRMTKMQQLCGENRVVIVLDGMGVSVMNKLLSPDGLFCRHLTDTETAIIPATTVAATTAYRTGKMPWETGFIGWSQYFSETDEVIEIFLNRNLYTGEVSRMPQHTNTLPCKTIVEEMVHNGLRAFEVMPAFAPDGFDTFEGWLNRIIELCNTETDAYIYAYWPEPDSAMHDNGIENSIAKDLLQDIEQKIESGLKQIKNKTSVLITADHGHKEIEHIFIEDYPDIAKCLLHPLSLESRCVSLFIKPEHVQEFPKLFEKHFGKWFKLVTKTEFETEYLHAEQPIRFIGDYVAMATDKYELKQDRKCLLLKSNHAGITPDEMNIPIIMYNI